MIMDAPYAVTKHGRDWGVSVYGAAFLVCSSYSDAVGIAMNASAFFRKSSRAIAELGGYPEISGAQTQLTYGVGVYPQRL